jgi:hypothetical protein
MNINFVFDKISPAGIPVGNIICFRNNVTPEQEKFTAHLPSPNWSGYWWYYSHFDFTFKYTGENKQRTEVDFIRSAELNAHLNDLNIYPIFQNNLAHSVGVTTFNPEFLTYLDRNLIDYVNQDVLKIAILNLYDPVCPYDTSFTAKQFEFYCNKAGIKQKKNIVLVCSDNQNFVDEINNNPNSVSALNSFWYEKLTKFFLATSNNTTVENLTQINLIESYKSKIDKDKIFLFLTNRLTPERYLMYKMLEYKGLLQYSIYSCRSTDKNTSHTYIDRVSVNQGSYTKFTDYQNWQIQNIEINRKIFPQEENLTFFDPDINGSIYYPSWLDDTFFTLFTETDYYDKFLSEKTYKLFYYGHPFIFYGKQGTLAKIRSLGYKTYPMLFDESYDDISEKSFEKYDFITSQIAQYCSAEGKERLISVMPQMIETIEYNRQKFLNSDHYEIWLSLKNKS